MDRLAIFCEIDDFCQQFEPKFNRRLIADGTRKRIKSRRMSRAEVMTILVLFHRSGFRDLKTFYTKVVCKYWHKDFRNLLSYNRFVELQRDALILLGGFMQTRLGSCSGVSFVDASKIPICNNLRIKQNKVFEGVAKRGKTSTGWFYGFKIHLIVSDTGEILAWQMTLGNVDDRKPVPNMTKQVWGQLFGDKGYISQKLSELLGEDNVQLITKVKKNMKNKFMSVFEKLMLRKRAIIETIYDQLKNISQIEHTRHRSVWNFYTNVVCRFDRLHISSKETEFAVEKGIGFSLILISNSR